MIRITFTEEQLQQLHHWRFHHPHPRVQLKMETLLLKSQGLPHKQICHLLRISENTLRAYLRDFLAGGVENAITHELVTVTNDTYINAQSVCELLRKITALGLAVPVTLVFDNARYQKCKLVQQLADELGIELLFLPSHSPNLNLIERLWKFVKKQAFNAKYYENFAKFKTAIGGCIADASTKHKKELDSLLTLRFQTFAKAQLLAA